MSRILLFLSTGRCGTQFITELLSRAAGDRAQVVHEPLRAQYRPRLYLRAKNLADALEAEPVIREHFRSWDILLHSGKPVVETGWPIYAWLPYLADRYRGKIDIVHVVRNPIRFAFSMASHNFYTTKRNDLFTNYAALDPHDPGVKHQEYKTLWPTLNRVERCLFQWLEINEYAEELAERGMVALRWRSEDIFLHPHEFLSDIRKLNPIWGSAFQDIDFQASRVDDYQRTLAEKMDSVRFTVAVESLARKYGYSTDLESLGQELLDRFYSGPPSKKKRR